MGAPLAHGCPWTQRHRHFEAAATEKHRTQRRHSSAKGTQRRHSSAKGTQRRHSVPFLVHRAPFLAHRLDLPTTHRHSSHFGVSSCSLSKGGTRNSGNGLTACATASAEPMKQSRSHRGGIEAATSIHHGMRNGWCRTQKAFVEHLDLDVGAVISRVCAA